MNAKKVIIDCDPGIDDALALMLALSAPGLEILGITVVSGNVPAQTGSENALKVLDWMNRSDIPVYTGERLPLVRPYVDAMDTHGRDGLGESGYPPVILIKPKDDAVSFLAQTLRSTDQVSVIALGPLTNLARLFQTDPDAFGRIDELVSMGGCYKSHGNCSPVAEYNYWCDPHAARIVYEAFSTLPALAEKKIHMVGLDVTRQIVLTPNLLEYIRLLQPDTGRRITEITRFYFDFHWKQEGVIGCVINDPLAVAYFLDRSLCTGFDTYTTIETEGLCIGQSVSDAFDFWHKPANSHILTDTDPLRFWKFFLTHLLHGKEPDIEPVLRQILTAPCPETVPACSGSVPRFFERSSL